MTSVQRSTCLFSLMLIGFAGAGDAAAQRVDNKAVHAASAKFRAEVVAFETLVKKVRGIDRRDERIVDLFEESTKRVQTLAKNPRQTSRLKAEYMRMLKLQERAETAIFKTYTPHHDLIAVWQNVLWCQYLLEQEFAFHFEYPRHGNRVRKR